MEAYFASTADDNDPEVLVCEFPPSVREPLARANSNTSVATEIIPEDDSDPADEVGAAVSPPPVGVPTERISPLPAPAPRRRGFHAHQLAFLATLPAPSETTGVIGLRALALAAAGLTEADVQSVRRCPALAPGTPTWESRYARHASTMSPVRTETVEDDAYEPPLPTFSVRARPSCVRCVSGLTLVGIFLRVSCTPRSAVPRSGAECGGLLRCHDDWHAPVHGVWI